MIEGQWALRSCGSPSAAWQPMLCQRGLAPFYRPAIRSVQTAQELQIVRGAVLGFEEVVRAQGPRPRPAACWCQSMALKMASVRWDGGWRSLPPTPLPPGGLVRVLGPITCRGLQAQDRVLAHAARRTPCPGPCKCQPDHMQRRPSERLLRRRPRQSRPETCEEEVRGEVDQCVIWCPAIQYTRPA